MTSVILRTATRFMFPLLLLFALFLLLRGHDAPGGGFAGGLVAAAAFSLYTLAFGPLVARPALGVDPRALIAVGLLIAVAAGWFALARGQPFLTHRDVWMVLGLPGLGSIHLGTPFVFDLGVFLVVTGMTVTIVMALVEE